MFDLTQKQRAMLLAIRNRIKEVGEEEVARQLHEISQQNTFNANEYEHENNDNTLSYTKPTLRLFADYCCGFALWNDHNHNILDGSEEQLLELGVKHSTLAILRTMVYVHDAGDSHEPWEPEQLIAYEYLESLAKECLDRDIGDKFNIQVGSR